MATSTIKCLWTSTIARTVADYSITSAVDLNDVAYTLPGQYSWSSANIASSFSNAPSDLAIAGNMEVRRKLLTVGDSRVNSTSAIWVYGTQEITSWTGGKKWIRYFNSGSSGTFTFSSWYSVYSLY